MNPIIIENYEIIVPDEAESPAEFSRPTEEVEIMLACREVDEVLNSFPIEDEETCFTYTRG